MLERQIVELRKERDFLKSLVRGLEQKVLQAEALAVEEKRRAFEEMTSLRDELSALRRQADELGDRLRRADTLIQQTVDMVSVSRGGDKG